MGNYFLGNYYNVSIINLNYTISFIRISLNVIKKILALNHRFLIIDEHFLQYNSIFKKRQDFYFVFSHWINGLLTNFKNIPQRETLPTICLDSIPSLVFILRTDDHSEKHIYKEIKNLNLLSIKIIDGSENPSLYPYWIPGNYKSKYSRKFFLELIFIILKKFFFLKHRKFFGSLVEVLNKWEIEIN